MSSKGQLLPDFLESCLPEPLRRELQTLSSEIARSDLNEVRLRAGRPSSLTVAGGNRVLSVKLTAEDLQSTVTKLCGGSVYAFSETIREGYLRIGEGFRVGICGTYNEETSSVRNFSSLNIRIPHPICGISEPVSDYLTDGKKSLLLYSPPGIGKTTVLRDLAARLSGKENKRVALIDTRGELYIETMFSDCLCDVLDGYPRGMAIEAATRTLAPEYLICDEIGDEREAEAIVAAQNTGVPLLASAHASGTDELLLRPAIAFLHRHGVFDAYVGLSRPMKNGRLSRCFSFRFTPREEISC